MTEEKKMPFFSIKYFKYVFVPKHDVLVIILKHSDQCFHSIGWTKTKLLRIGTQQYSPYIFCQFQTVLSRQIIILDCHNYRYIKKEK